MDVNDKEHLIKDLLILKEKTENQVDEIHNMIYMCRSDIPEDDFMNRLSNFTIEEERLFLQRRKLYSYLPQACIKTKHDIYTPEVCNIISDEIDFTMDLVDDDVWQLTLPKLPNRQYKGRDRWVKETLFPLVYNRYKEITDPMPEYPKIPDKATLVIIHHYDESSNVRVLTDVDNYDTKYFIDTLTPTIIFSDSICYLQIYSIGQPDTSFFTEAVVMPTDKFIGWLSDRN
jgi:hypothetical protein